MRKKLPNRKRNRMLGFDYSRDAIYFLTACCKNRISHFGKIEAGIMHLNDYGRICHNQIAWLQSRYPYTKLHNFIVMPNHVHILIEINREFLKEKKREIEGGIKNAEKNNSHPVRTSRDLSPHEASSKSKNPKERASRDLPQQIKSISSLMGAMKTTSSKKIHKLGNTDFQWQRSFHDIIVRNFRAYSNIYNYISDNPKRWQKDKFN